MPVQKEEGAVFTRWSPEVTPQLGPCALCARLKTCFFPQCEALYTLKTEQGKLQIAPQKRAEEPFAVFGMRGCDARALQVLDQVFLTEPVDTFYKARRENGVLLTLACRRPDTACFCTVFQMIRRTRWGMCAWWMGIPVSSSRPKRKKGQDFLDRFCFPFDPLARNRTKPLAGRNRKTSGPLPPGCPFVICRWKGWGPGQTDARFSDPRWDALSKKLFGVRYLYVCVPGVPVL